MYNFNAFSRSVRFVLASLLVLFVSTAVLAANPKPAAAAGEAFYSTTVRCWPGEYTFKDNVYGAYDGQWGAIRHYISTWIPGQGWVQSAPTDWVVVRLPGPNTAVVGGNLTVPTPVGTYIALATEVAFWNGSSWSTPQYLNANHFQNGGSLAMSYCRT